MQYDVKVFLEPKEIWLRAIRDFTDRYGSESTIKSTAIAHELYNPVEISDGIALLQLKAPATRYGKPIQLCTKDIYSETRPPKLAVCGLGVTDIETGTIAKTLQVVILWEVVVDCPYKRQSWNKTEQVKMVLIFFETFLSLVWTQEITKKLQPTS